MLKPFFQKNHITLYCGNSLEIAAELKASGAHFDLMLTDPPYGLNQAKKKPSGVNAERAKAAYRRIAQGTDLISDLSTEINLYAMTLQAAMAITEI